MSVPRAGAKPQPFPPSDKPSIKFKYYNCHMTVKSYPWGRRLAQPCQSVARRRGHGFDPGEIHIILYKTISQPQGAMWQPMTGPHGTSTPNHKLPSVVCRMVHVTYHLSTCASTTCLPCTLSSCQPVRLPRVCPVSC
jgi:hypothetical protein